MYFLLNMGIFQPAMFVQKRFEFKDPVYFQALRADHHPSSRSSFDAPRRRFPIVLVMRPGFDQLGGA